MDTLDDVLQSLGPMPIAQAPREDPYGSSSDDESAAARKTRKKRSPSPLTDNTKRAVVKKEATDNGGTFTFSVDDELESPPPSDDEEAFMDPLLDFDQQDSSFALVSGASSGKVAGTEVKDFTLEDFTSLVQGIAKSTQEKMAAKEREQARLKGTKGREGGTEFGREKVKDRPIKEMGPAQPKKDPPELVATEAVFEPSFVKKKHARIAPPPPKKVTSLVSPTTKNELKSTPTSVTVDSVVWERKASPPLETLPKGDHPKLVSEEKKGGGGGYELPNGNEHGNTSVEQTDSSPTDADNEPPYATVDQLMLGSDGAFVTKRDTFDPNYSTIPDLVVMEERPAVQEPPYASILELTAGTSLGTSPTMLPSDDGTRSPSPRSGSQSPDVDEIPPQTLDDHPYSRVIKGTKQYKKKSSQVSAHTHEDPSLAQVKEGRKERGDDPPYARVRKLKETGNQLVDPKDDPPYARVKKQKRKDDKSLQHAADHPNTGVTAQTEWGAEPSLHKQDEDPPYARIKKQKQSGSQPMKHEADPPYASVMMLEEEAAEETSEHDDDPPYARIKRQNERDVEQPAEQANDPPYARVKKQMRHSKERHTHADATATGGLQDLADAEESSSSHDVSKPRRDGRGRRAKSPTSPHSSQSPEVMATKPTSPVRKAPPLPPARKTKFGDDENPYSEISELILPLSQLGVQATATSKLKEEQEAVGLGTFSDSVSAGIERGRQRSSQPTEPAKRQRSPPPSVPTRQAPAVPKQHQAVAKTQSVEQSIAKQPKRFWKRLSIGDKSGKGDNDQVMLKGFQSHSEKPPSSIPEAVQQDPSSSKAATHLDSEAPAVPPYKPSSPDSFPLSNRKGYVAQQQEGKALQSGSASNVELAKKGGGGTGLTSQQLKAMRRLSIQGQSVSLRGGGRRGQLVG